MLRGASGYTILELMIVLAVSVIVLVSASIAIGGSNGKTQFTASMRDVNNKMQDWLNDVATGFPGGTPSLYNCTLSATNRPQINPGTGSANPNCIFVGKVIQATTSSGCSGCAADQGGKLYAYSIFGRRAVDTNGTLASSLSDTNPVPAVGNTNPAARAGSSDLTEVYNLLGGTTIKSITSQTAAGPREGDRLLGLFESFGSNSTANGAQDINVYSGLNTNAPAANTAGGSTVSDCIETLSCNIGTTLTSWKACFQSAYTDQTAQITITSTSGIGAQTKLEFISC